jgi:hypothetical protein
MSDLECLSILELLDIRNGAAPGDSQAHARDCPRCSFLLATLQPVDQPQLSTPEVEVVGRPQTEPPERVGSGQVWAVPSPDPDLQELVVIVGRSPEREDQLVAAPISTEVGVATDFDLLLDPDLLGYAAMADMASQGLLFEAALKTYIGRIERPQAERLVALYRAVAGDGEMPEDARTGPPVCHPEDPRLVARQARRERFAPLWQEVDATVDAEEPEPQAEPLSELLSQAMAQEWDRNSLLEATSITGEALDAFSADQLDLTDESDIEQVGALIWKLQLPLERALPAVEASLTRSAGGLRVADQDIQRAAARSKRGTDPAKVTDLLFAGSSRIDDSAAARRKAISRYLRSLEKALQDLGES